MKALILGGLIACTSVIGSTSPSAHAQGLQQEAPDPEVIRAERFYRSGIQALRTKEFASAVAYFERSLEVKRNTSDVFFNLVQATRKTEQWDKLVLYGQAFLFREPDTKDAAVMAKLVAQTFDLLHKLGRDPVSYRFAISPAGSEIRIDGVPVANDTREIRLMPGKYVITVEPIDYLPWREELNVKPGAAGRTIEHTLAAQVYHSKVKLVTEPGDGVQVFLDDAPVGVTPLAELELETGRRYLFRFEHPGFDSWVRYVTLVKGEVLVLKPRMQKTPGNQDQTAKWRPKY